MNLEKYLDNIINRHALGNTTEHSFRGDLQQLLETLFPEIRATNEPKRQACGAPDYILTKKDLPIGFIEAKDIGDKDLDGLKKTGNKEQFDRYKTSLHNIIFTDYLSFHLYRSGQFISKVTIAELKDHKIKPLRENFASFENLIKDFCTNIGQTIKNPQDLAKMMAGKARILAEVIEKALTSDETNQENSTLKDQLNAFQQVLIHDIKPKGFADVYAQTIAYGMFAARLHDSTLDTFSRQEAAELIPKSNPFLRKLFSYIAGIDLDDRIKWVVDDLVNIFLACDVKQMLGNYGKATQTEDPIIHFYEDFLSEYDPALRKARGVWYTPAPVVNFIVRAVDDILKTEFDLPQGLADNSKTQEVHKVQILDPATGTGTFLAEIVKQIHKKFKGQQGIWSNYVESHLLPRLNGFELLMASYAMAHLKLDLLLTETGYKPTSNKRFRVYLTNSLEEYHPDSETLFANWLSAEANEANRIKRDVPVMCIIGNPPYSGESANKGEWIQNLIADYKKDHNYQKISDTKWLNNDYVKFLRYGQYFIEKNGSGILAFITDNSFLDSISFRGMRYNLLKTYDTIYIVNLHGNSLKKETSPDGSTDQNVFDIMQGVSINIFIKTGKKKPDELGKVFHFDLFGKRAEKYKFLLENSFKTVEYKELPNIAPNYFFVPKDFSSQGEYDTFIKIDELFDLGGVGICSKRDHFTINQSKVKLTNTIKHFISIQDEEARNHFNLGKDTDWKISEAKKALTSNPDFSNIKKINYRPFDINYTYYSSIKGFHARPVYNVMKHFMKFNYGLIVSKKSRQLSLGYMFITNSIVDLHILDSAADSTYTFPLYLYSENPRSASDPLEGQGFCMS